MQLRKAVLADLRSLAEMNRQLIRDSGHRNPMNLVQLTRRMKGWLQKEYQAWIFLEKSQVAGYCLFRREKEFLYIRQFYVGRPFRRTGLGRRAFGWLRRNPWKTEKRLRMDVLVGNKGAIDFWKAVGFKDYCLTMERENL